MKQIAMRNLELKKYLRGVRPIERSLEQRTDVEAVAIRGYCLAVRSALTDDGRPPLEASGLKLHKRISAIVTSLTHSFAESCGRLSLRRERTTYDFGISRR
jgi:hypothetical protein